MPTSNLACWPRILNMVETIRPAPRSLLDVGAGHGKAAVLLREYLNAPPDRIDAVEAWQPYVDDFGLHELYDAVIEADVRQLDDATLAGYDAVLLVDVIEHLSHDDGVELLARTPGWIVVCTPAEFFDNGPGLPPTETHRSLWTVDDFAALDGRLDTHATEHGGLFVRLHPSPGR